VRPIRPAFDETDHDESMLEVVAERFGLRDWIRAHPIFGWVYRGIVALLGIAIILLGLVLVPAPGPGWLIVLGGLAVLATEFAWARRALRYARTTLHRWTEWAKRQPLIVRMLLGAAGFVLIAVLALASLWSLGWNRFPFA
jgi:uncharacterized protein (TIGR02611 family)